MHVMIRVMRFQAECTSTASQPVNMWMWRKCCLWN